MVVINVSTAGATVELSSHELSMLANALNETMEAVEEWEFSARVGADVAEAEALRSAIKVILRSVGPAAP